MSAFSTFEHVSTQHITSLNIDISHYKHKITAADHYHLISEDKQNVFFVGFRTIPNDNTGVAHILEHTVLCGSKKYPVRDPFFMMIRRSLNTFMNAFTSSDWTAYPFATENNKDFNNLLKVYLDAAFFPNLNELDFAQEGHRLEFSESTNPDSNLEYKGVVFNEMKGAMSSPITTLWQKITKELYPSSTYHYNSGGEPENIPELTHQQLVDFHRKHYHPTNAVFMTYGNISAYDHQKQFEELALYNFKEKSDKCFVDNEKRYTSPKKIIDTYAVDDEDTSKKTHIVMAWLLGENKNPKTVLKAHLLSSVLLDNSSSPVRKVLETCDFITAPSPLCGLEDSNKEMSFILGVQGSEKEYTDKVENLIINTLQEVVDNGIPQEQLEAMLHQLELSQLEITGDTYPYGLQLMLHALPGAMHNGEPMDLLDLDKVLSELREDIMSKNFITKLIQEWLLDNKHRVTLTLEPNSELSSKTLTLEKSKLNIIKQGLTTSKSERIIDKTKKLKDRQEQEDDPAILPEVTKDDIPKNVKTIVGKKQIIDNIQINSYEVATNGISYEEIIVELPNLTEEEADVIPLFNNCITELGCGERDYIQTQEYQASISGGIDAHSVLHSHLHEDNNFYHNFILSGKALNRNQLSLNKLLYDTLLQPRFDETQRIKDLLEQIQSSVENGITSNGHSLAMMAASQNYTPVASWNFKRNGFLGLKKIKSLDKVLSDTNKTADLINNFKSIANKINGSTKQFLLIDDKNGISSALDSFEKVWTDALKPATKNTDFNLVASHEPVKQAWSTNTQVNFCALSFPAVNAGHADAPKLAVLAACLRNGYLHSAIRERGGAYGGGANYSSDSHAFCFFSYRDPRLMETFTDFFKAKDWLLSNGAKESHVNEAILNVISAMDKPSSPSSEASKSFYQKLYGLTPDYRQEYRENILSTTLKDLRRLAETYLVSGKESYAVLTNQKELKKLSKHGFECFSI